MAFFDFSSQYMSKKKICPDVFYFFRGPYLGQVYTVFTVGLFLVWFVFFYFFSGAHILARFTVGFFLVFF